MTMRWSPLALIFVFACLSTSDPDGEPSGDPEQASSQEPANSGSVDAPVPVSTGNRVVDSSENPNPFGLTLYGRIEDAMAGTLDVGATFADLDVGHGVGLLGGRDGAVLITGGKALAATVEDGKAVTTPLTDPKAEITFFAGVPEPTWADHLQDSNLDAMALGSRIANWQESTKTPDTAPIPFRIEGVFDKLVIHVPDGSKLKGKTTLKDHRKSGVTLEFAAEEAILIGLQSPGHEGEFTHPGETILAHAIVGDPPQIGHVDDWSSAAGAVLKLPAR